MKKLKSGVVILIAIALFCLDWYHCPFALVTGLPCPGCGMTRALWSALTGQWTEVFMFHPLWPLIVGFGVYLIVLRLVSKKPINLDDRKVMSVMMVIGTLMIIVWVVRMVVVFPNYPMEYTEPNLLKNIYDFVGGMRGL